MVNFTSEVVGSFASVYFLILFVPFCDHGLRLELVHLCKDFESKFQVYQTLLVVFRGYPSPMLNAAGRWKVIFERPFAMLSDASLFLPL